MGLFSFLSGKKDQSSTSTMVATEPEMPVSQASDVAEFAPVAAAPAPIAPEPEHPSPAFAPPAGSGWD